MCKEVLETRHHKNTLLIQKHQSNKINEDVTIFLNFLIA